MMNRVRICALLTVLLLLLTVTGCRNRDFSPASPPNPPGVGKYPDDFQCWVLQSGEVTGCLTDKEATEVFKAVKKAYKKSHTAERFSPGEECIMLVFCTGGTAPEAIIPAYQLPNSHHYGVYILYPDDTATYRDVLLTANMKFFVLEEGSYEQIAELVK